MRESSVERYLKKRVEDLGGKCIKFHPENWRGAPDRIVLLPGGITYFVELKAPGKKPRKQQEYRHKQLRELGQKVLVLDSKEAIATAITDIIATKPPVLLQGGA